MRTALGLVLLAAIAWLLIGQVQRAPLQVQDTMLVRADVPQWGRSPADEMLFAPCPLSRRMLPKTQKRTA